MRLPVHTRLAAVVTAVSAALIWVLGTYESVVSVGQHVNIHDGVLSQ